MHRSRSFDPRTRRGRTPAWTWSLVLLAWSASISLAADLPEGAAKGEILFNQKTVAIAHAAIYAEDEGFYDPADPTWTLVLTGEPVTPRNVDDPFHDPSLIVGITWTSEFGDEPSLEVLSHTLYFDNTSLSGGGEPELEITARDGSAWVGRISLPEQQFFDKTYSYEVAFHATLLDRNAPIGEPLSEGGGEPGTAYLTWTKAIHSGDLDRLRPLVPAELAAMLDEPDAAESLELLAAMTPRNVRIVSGSMVDGEAILQIEGSVENEPVKGEITMTRQGDLWMPTNSALE